MYDIKKHLRQEMSPLIPKVQNKTFFLAHSGELGLYSAVKMLNVASLFP